MTDYATARRHMVDGQVRTADVTDLRIICGHAGYSARAIRAAGVRAGLPISTSMCRLATARVALLKPMVFAKLIQAADIAAD